MYYKVLKNGRVIDALDRLQFVKYQPKHDIMAIMNLRKKENDTNTNMTKSRPWEVQLLRPLLMLIL